MGHCIFATLLHAFKHHLSFNEYYYYSFLSVLLYCAMCPSEMTTKWSLMTKHHGTTMVYHGKQWYTMVHITLPWYIVSIPWYILVPPWYNTLTPWDVTVYHGKPLCNYGTSMVQITYHGMLSLIKIYYTPFPNLPEIWPAEKVSGRLVFMSGTELVHNQQT